MKKKRLSRIFVITLVLILVLPSGLLAYSMVGGQFTDIAQMISGESKTIEKQPLVAEVQAPVEVAQNTGSIEVSLEIEEVIRQQDPANFDKNIANYKNLLARLNVHSTYKNEMERLLREGHRLPDILVAYEFLNDSYGILPEIENLVKVREAGKSWSGVFMEYNAVHPEFVPASFDRNYLEKLMNTHGITSDDIMIADRVAQKAGKPVKEVIDKRIAGGIWKDINAEYSVVNAQDRLIHVPATPEQLDKYMNNGMTRQKVIQAFVIAAKMERNAEEIIEKVKSGVTKEQIYDECYTQKYY